MSKKRGIFYLFLVAAGWSLLFVFLIQLKIGFPFLGDDWSYMQAAKKLYLHGEFDEGRPLLIAAVNGLPLLFGLDDATVVKWSIAVNFACWLFTAVFIFRILTVPIGMKKAFFCALLFLSCVGAMATVFHLMPEPIFVFAIVLAVFFLNQHHLSQNPGSLALAITVLVFSILVKPVAAGLTVVVVLFYIRKWKQLLLNRFSVLALAGIVLIGVQMRGMKSQYGDYTISYIGMITYYNYLGAKADCLKKDTVFIPGENARAKHFSQFTSHDQKQLVADDIKLQLNENKVNLVKAYLYCLFTNSTKGSYIVSQGTNEKNSWYFDVFFVTFKTLSKIQNIVFTIAGVLLSFYFLLRRKKQSGFLAVVSLILLYIFFISGMSCWQGDRFHLVFFPLAIILAAHFFGNKKASPNEPAL